MTTPRTRAEELAAELIDFVENRDAYPYSSAGIADDEWAVLRHAAAILAEAVKR